MNNKEPFYIAPEGVCPQCKKKYSDDAIWKTLWHFREKNGVKPMITNQGFTHLTGCKNCSLQFPPVYKRAKLLAQVLIDGDGMKPEHAFFWVMAYYMGGDLYENGKIVHIQSEENTIKKIEKIKKNLSE